MGNNNIFTIGIAIIAIVATVGFFVWTKTNNQSSSVNPMSISQSGWKVYENTAYHYSMKYPQSWNLGQVQEEERGGVEVSREMIVFLPGGKGVVGVTTWDPSVFKITDQASAELHKTITVDLRLFAEAARQKELSDKNPNFPNKEVSDLQETLFADQKTFSYAVTNSTDSYGSSNDRYLFLEKNSIKYEVYYSLDFNLPQEIADTFEFTNSSTTTSN